jgi:hypothetical protein
LGRLRKEIRLEDGMTAPARVRVLEKLQKNAWVEIEIHEGRNREVRRMFEALGYFVEKLIRVRIGNVELSRLAPGEIRPLMRTESSSSSAPSAYKIAGQSPTGLREEDAPALVVEFSLRDTVTAVLLLFFPRLTISVLNLRIVRSTARNCSETLACLTSQRSGPVINGLRYASPA